MHQFVNSRCSFIFPGTGMNDAVCTSVVNNTLFGILKNHTDCVMETMGIDIWNYIISNNSNALKCELTEQIAIYTVTCSVAEFYKEMGIEPSMLCGYSMGIYSALVCGEAINFKIGLNIIQSAYRIIRSSLNNAKGAMACIIGFSRIKLEDVLSASVLSYPVEIANENSKLNMVITGFDEDVKVIMENANRKGALKVIKINVSIPYHHTQLLEKSASQFFEYINDLNINDLKIPLISCINQRILTSNFDIKNELYKNIASNISWYKSINKAASYGIDEFIETGTDGCLQRISKTISKDCKFYSLRNIIQPC